MKDDELDAIKARVEAAPEGPWRTYPNPMRSDGVFVAQDRPPTFYHGTSQPTAVPDGAWGLPCQVEPAVGEFIAHARTDTPALLAEIDRLKAHGIPAHQRELAERLVSMGHAWFNSGKIGADRYRDVAPILSAMTYLLDDLVHGRTEPRTYYQINDDQKGLAAHSGT